MLYHVLYLFCMGIGTRIQPGMVANTYSMSLAVRQRDFESEVSQKFIVRPPLKEKLDVAISGIPYLWLYHFQW